MCHVLKEHAQRVSTEDHSQEADYVGMPQIRHQVNLSTEVLLSFSSGIFLQSFNGN
jgi:hypothetical protein